MKEGWVSKKIKEVCVIRPPKKEASDKISENDLVSFVPMEDLGVSQKYLSPTKEKKLSEVEGSYTYFSNGDVLLAKVTPCFENGKLGIAQHLINNVGFGSSEYVVYRPNSELLSEYLYYFLSQDSVRRAGKKSMGGAVGLQRIQKSFYEEMIISFPSLSEQKKIVAILDDVFARLDKAKANVEKNLKNAEDFYQGKLESTFEKSGVEWSEKTFDEAVKFIDYRGRTPVKTKSGVRLITAKNVKLGYLQLDPQEFIAADSYDEWMRRGIPNYGDVIFTTEAPLGNVAQINTHEKLAFAQRIIVMQPRSDELLQEFLKYALLSPFIRERIFAEESGATVTGIKAKVLKKILIPVPPVAEQKKVIHELRATEEDVSQLKRIYSVKLASIEELRKSVLEKAFKGELIQS